MGHRYDRTGERIEEPDLEELHDHPLTPEEIHAHVEAAKAAVARATATLSDGQESRR